MCLHPIIWSHCDLRYFLSLKRLGTCPSAEEPGQDPFPPFAQLYACVPHFSFRPRLTENHRHVDCCSWLMYEIPSALLPIFRDLNSLGPEDGVGRVMENTNSVADPTRAAHCFHSSSASLKLSELRFPHKPIRLPSSLTTATFEGQLE